MNLKRSTSTANKSKHCEQAHRPPPRQRVNSAEDEPIPADSSSDEASGQQSDQAQEAADLLPAFVDDASFSSPETALHGAVDANYETHRSRLLAAPAHRCVRVAENTRGVQCVAVATGMPAASGVNIQVLSKWCMSARSTVFGLAGSQLPYNLWSAGQILEHVLCIPMTFMPGSDGSADRRVAFVCSCSDMASNVESIVSRHTARMTYSGMIHLGPLSATSCLLMHLQAR